MLKGIGKLVAARGKKVVEFDLKKEIPQFDELEKVMIGPSGNLRAPAIKIGKTMLVGFHQEMYEGHIK